MPHRNPNIAGFTASGNVPAGVEFILLMPHVISIKCWERTVPRYAIAGT